MLVKSPSSKLIWSRKPDQFDVFQLGRDQAEDDDHDDQEYATGADAGGA